MKDLDIVVYGATGFTGKLCADYIHASGRPIKWAIAGRNGDKLKTAQAGLSPQVEIIIADGDDGARQGHFVYRRAVSQIWLEAGGGMC